MANQPYRLVHKDKPEITLVSLSDEGLKLLLGAPDLLEAVEEVEEWVHQCPDCEGTGKDPICPQDACHRCGGYGEEVYGDIMEAVLGIRLAIANAKDA